MCAGLHDVNRYLRPLLPAGVVVILLAARPPAVRGITPDNPRVRAAVARALEYLEGTNEGRLGAKALVGLTFTKAGKKDHPKVTLAIKAIQASLTKGSAQFNADIYSTGISIMLLVAVDPSKYRFEIEQLVESLHRRQKDHGAWGYPPSNPNNGRTCDTSMTQYAVLGLWEAEDLAGIETPRLVWDRVARWLLLTQDPGGGVGYQGRPAETLGKNVKQSGVKHSMTVAALGSLYIVKDRVGIARLKKRVDDDTPAEFQPYESPEQRAARIKTRIDLRLFARALADGNRWMEDKYRVGELTNYVHYSLYALERFESLREAQAAGRSEPTEKTDKSKWYNRAAIFLLKTQKADGSWESQTGPIPDTCFASLCLMGSTRATLARASIRRYRGDTLIGGQGIPDAQRLRLRDGRVVVEPASRPFDRVLTLLTQPGHPDYLSAVESLADAARSTPVEPLGAHRDQLLELALHGPPAVRPLAIACLGRIKDLDQAGYVVCLVRDPSRKVSAAAESALKNASRRSGPPDAEDQDSAVARENAFEYWAAWYRTVRPDVDLTTLARRVR